MTTHTDLYPRLIVSRPDEALDFYSKAMNASVIERFVDDQNRVVHAAFSIGNAVLSLAQSEPDWGAH